MRRLGSASVLCVFISVLAAASELDNLARDLKSRNADTRVRAVETLGRLKSAEAAELLAQALSDREARVRSAAARALWNSYKVAKGTIPALLNTLDDPEPYVVVCAAGALLAMDVPPKEVADPLRGVLRRGDPHDRFQAARLLIGIEPAANLVAPIVEHLRRNLPDQRNDVSETIDRMHNFEDGTKALVKLGKSQDRTQIDPLMTQLSSAPAPMVPPILTALGELKTPPDRWTDTLMSLLASPAVPVRAKAVELLGKQTKDADIRKWAPAVARLTKDPEVRGWALSTLEEGKGLAHGAFGSVLQMIASDGDARLRARAAGVAGEIGDAKYPIDSAIKASMGKEALPVLTAAIEKDPDAGVRENALQSLARLQLDPADVAPVLARAAVNGKKSGFRTDALILLGNLGSGAAAARATIEPLTRDPDPEVARIAKSTLQSMTSSRTVLTPAPAAPAPARADPASRDRGLAHLREKDLNFTPQDFARVLRELEPEAVAAFLDAGMSPNQRFSYGTLPLQIALESDYECDQMKPVVRLLLDRGADANGTDENGNTVLMTAAKACDGEMIRTLIKAGAKADAKNATGFSVLESAIFASNVSAGKALITAGARISTEKAKMYRETFKEEPKVLEIIKLATK